jgi:hypothetical protein
MGDLLVPFVDGVPVIDGLPADVIADTSGEPYMERFFLTEGKTVRLHHILRSDADRELHDHPWDFFTLLLDGRYIETTEGGEELEYAAPALLFRSAETLHRLTLPDGPVWTYVVTGPLRREWGFQTDDGWVPWHEYHARGRVA